MALDGLQAIDLAERSLEVCVIGLYGRDGSIEPSDVAPQQASSIQAYLERRATDLKRGINTRVEVVSFDGMRRMV